MSVADLTGKKGLVLGIANVHSIAYGCAQIFKQQGAEIGITYQNDKTRPHVEHLAEELNASLFMKCDVTDECDLDTVFKQIEMQYGRLDFLLHSIAFAPRQDLHGTVSESSKDGFLTAMDISCHSFARLARRSVPLMKNGGCLLTMSYYGAQQVVEQYGVMGPVKAALESTAKYMAAELGPKDIRVNVISPGPLETRAASGIRDFDRLLEEAKKETPSQKLVTIHDIGRFAAFLVSEDAASITGGIHYIDAGHNIID